MTDARRSLDKAKAFLPPGYAIVQLEQGVEFFEAASLFWLNGNIGPGRAKGDRFAKAFQRMWKFMVEKAVI